MPTISPNAKATLDAAKLYDMTTDMLMYECETCRGQFGEGTVEAVLKRAAANTHGDAITPELEAAVHAARMREEARALLVYHCSTCHGEFDERTVEAVLKRAAANTHGESITPTLEAALAA